LLAEAARRIQETAQFCTTGFRYYDRGRVDQKVAEDDKSAGQIGTRFKLYSAGRSYAHGLLDIGLGEVLADYPDLKPEDLRACLAFAADQGRAPQS
jgi:Protein of unknown function (DUF433)